MNASIIVAICATVIAVFSLAVTVYEAWATRRHDRISVHPFLELRIGLRQGRTAGLQLINSGLGPALITNTILTLDGTSRRSGSHMRDLLRAAQMGLYS
jgi:hypothetical protein